VATRADIEVNVKGLKKVQELSKLLDKVSGKVNQLNQGAGSAAKNNKLEKESLKLQENKQASMVRVRSIGDQIQKAKEAGLKTDKATRSINKAALANDKGKLVLAKAHMKSAMNELEAERATTQEMRSQLRFSKLLRATRSRGGGGGGAARPDKFNDRSNAAAVRSGLISGAFPLLFGQGPLGAAAGFTGGFVGTKLGGQMGGFAGGLVATAALQQIQNAINGIQELGKALGPFAKNTDAVTAALGLQGSAEEARIQMIEKTQGKTAAFNAAMQVMNVQIGERGVDALTEFGEMTRLMNTEFAIAITRIGAFTAGIINFVNKTLGIQQGLKEGEANRALKLGIAEKDPRALELQARQAEIDAMPKVKQIVDVPGIDGPQKQIIALPSKQAEEAQAVLDLDKQRFSVIRKTEAEAALLTERFDSLIRANEKEEKLTARVLELRKNGLNPEVAKTVAEIEKGASISKEALDIEIAKLQNNKELDVNQKARLDTLIAEKTAIDEGVKGLDKKLQKTHDLTAAATQTLDAFQNINRTIQNDIKEGIKGLIKGTSTLGDLLNNVADRFLDIALNQGLFGNAGGKTITGGLFKMLGFADGGRPPVNRPSIVGEKGPELFVPRSSGNIIPNNKLGGGSTNNVVVNVDASGSDVQGDEAAAKEIGTLISVAVQGELLKQQRPGGLLSR